MELRKETVSSRGRKRKKAMNGALNKYVCVCVFHVEAIDHASGFCSCAPGDGLCYCRCGCRCCSPMADSVLFGCSLFSDVSGQPECGWPLRCSSLNSAASLIFLSLSLSLSDLPTAWPVASNSSSSRSTPSFWTSGQLLLLLSACQESKPSEGGHCLEHIY